MCIYCDYCVYHYKSTELVSLYTLDVGLQINIIIMYSRPDARKHTLFILFGFDWRTLMVNNNELCNPI